MLLVLQDAVDYTIDVRFVAIEQVPQLITFAYNGVPVRIIFQAQDGFFEPPVPFQGCVGMLSMGLLL